MTPPRGGRPRPRPARRDGARSGASARRSGARSGAPGGARGGGSGRRGGGSGRQSTAGGLGGDQVEGRRAVRELLAAGRRPVRVVWLGEGLDPSPVLDEIEQLASRRHVRVETVSRSRLERTAMTEAHQGVVARAQPVEPVDLDELCEAKTSSGDASFLLVVDGVTDPRNLGALLRSAECAGVSGIVLPRHRAAHLSPTAAKVAAGAIEHLAFALAGGIPTALSQLKDRGFWVVGLAAESARSLYDVQVGDGPVALVVGGEERGLGRLVRSRCDEVAGIPQHGAVASLNVGAAAAVACFEVSRRRAVEVLARTSRR